MIKRAADSEQPWAETLASDLEYLHEVGTRFAGGSEGPYLTSHRDFVPWNVFPSAADGLPVVLDWENAGAAAPVAELAAALLDWTCDDAEVDLDSAQAFASAYRAVSGFRAELRPESFNSAVVTNLNFLEAMADQAIHDETNRAFAEEWLPRLMPDALRRALEAIDVLVAAEL